MVIAAVPPFISIGPSWCGFCHSEGIGCSTSYGVTNNWVRKTSDNLESRIRYKNPFLGDTQFNWWHMGRKNCIPTVSVAADYPDSVPESSNYVAKNGYHPLEEIKTCKRVRETILTGAEIAKTTVEANNNAFLIFPGTIHCEPHEHISWAEYPYVIDDGGDIYFRVPDDANIMQDPEASNPVNVLIGMDLPLFENQLLYIPESRISDNTINDISFFNEYYDEDENPNMLGGFIEWNIPIDSAGVHPIYFAKSLTKATNTEYGRKMNHPSNGVSVLGCLSPAYVDEELYLRRLFRIEDNDGYDQNWKDEDVNCSASLFYRLEIMRIDLFSVYGVQSAINLQDFRDAEPDILVHSIPDIIAHFADTMDCNLPLKSLCKKNGFYVEEANIIGVDSLGMDVRVFTGREVQTHRFPFKIRATSETSAEKQIQQLLYPRARRKRLTKTRSETIRRMD